MELFSFFNVTSISILPTIGPENILSNHIALALYNTVLGILFGYIVYDIDKNTASKAVIVSLFYNMFMHQPFSMVRMTVLVLISFTLLRILIGKDNTYMVDGMLSTVLQEIPSYEIMGAVISFMDYIPSLIEAYGSMGIQYIRGSESDIESNSTSGILEPVYSKGTVLVSYLVTSLKTIVLFLSIIMSGYLAPFTGKNPDLPRPPRREDVSVSDFLRNQSKRLIVCGLFVFGEAYFREGLCLIRSIVQIVKFGIAYTTYYALGSLKLNAKLKNLVAGSIFGVFFAGNEKMGLSDMAAVLILAPSSGVIRKAYLLYQYYMGQLLEPISPKREILSMFEMIVAYSSGMFASMILHKLTLSNCVDGPKALLGLSAHGIRIAILLYAITRVANIDSKTFNEGVKKVKSKIPYIDKLLKPKTQPNTGKTRSGATNVKKQTSGNGTPVKQVKNRQPKMIPVATSTVATINGGETIDKNTTDY